MPLDVRYYTDPACHGSWAMEPALRRLMVEFGADLSITYVMGGLARELEGDPASIILDWLDASDRSGMPVDPRLWREAPLRSTYPACIAVKAAAEQGPEAAGRYLRRVREGVMCFRRKLDAKEALVEQARAADLDVERFRIDLDSNAILEAFAADLDEARDVQMPALRFGGAGDSVSGEVPYERLRAAALAAGASPTADGALDPVDVVTRFGRVATVEVQALCELPGPRAEAELWRLAADWRLRPVRVLTGTLWELP